MASTITNSPEETHSYGKELGARLSGGAILCFEGDLGAGKTTLIKGIVEGATGCSADEVTSPTFTLLNIYSDRVYHFDLYRLKDEEDFIGMGFDEYLGGDNICCIEWSERLSSLLTERSVIRITSLSETQREIVIKEVA